MLLQRSQQALEKVNSKKRNRSEAIIDDSDNSDGENENTYTPRQTKQTSLVNRQQAELQTHHSKGKVKQCFAPFIICYI